MALVTYLVRNIAAEGDIVDPAAVLLTVEDDRDELPVAEAALAIMCDRQGPAEVLRVEALDFEAVAGRFECFGQLISWCDRETYGYDAPAARGWVAPS